MTRATASRCIAITFAAATCLGWATGQKPSGLNRALDRAISEIREQLGQEDIWEDHTQWEDPWVVQTEHYEVRTVHGYGIGRAVADGLEVMLGHFQETLQSDFTPSERFKIFIVPDTAKYNELGDAVQDNHAAHHSSKYGSFYHPDHAERPVVVIYDPNTTWLQMLITHSALHQFLASAFQNSPPDWVSEGLAGYFSLFWSPDWGIDQFERMRDGGSLSPARQLLGEAIDAYPAQSTGRFVELGMLFNYLLLYREDTRTTAEQAPFRDYLVAHLRGDDVSDLPVHEIAQNLNALDADFGGFDFRR